MSANSTIEWCDATWNPVTGCDHVSPGCDNCYAERIATRFGRPFLGAVQCHPDRLEMPLRWRKPRRVFVNSVSDLFHPDVPDEFIADVFDVMRISEAHTFQVLTKRSRRMAEFARSWWLPNVWLGVSAENQRYSEIRTRDLLSTPAAVRFLSCEPLLGPISLPTQFQRASERDAPTWVIVGGESGPGARRMELAWAEAIVDRCRRWHVPVFVKQLGSAYGRDHHDIATFPLALQVREYPEVTS